MAYFLIDQWHGSRIDLYYYYSQSTVSSYTLLVFAGLQFRVFRDCKKIALFNTHVENSNNMNIVPATICIDKHILLSSFSERGEKRSGKRVK